MPRDRWFLEQLDDHEVLTTEQVAALCLDHLHTARNRLAKRPRTHPGAASTLVGAHAHYGFRATPQYWFTSMSGSPGSGRHREHETTPGVNNSNPSK